MLYISVLNVIYIKISEKYFSNVNFYQFQKDKHASYSYSRNEINKIIQMNFFIDLNSDEIRAQ